VRLKGFSEGYRRGKLGVEFLRKMALPAWAIRIRWFSVAVLAGLAVWLLSGFAAIGDGAGHLLFGTGMLALILAFLFLLRRGISQIFILYGGVILLVIISCQEWFTWWK
jgi:PTS system mannose-specific IID component